MGLGLKMKVEAQVRIIESQLACFDTPLDKLVYMNMFFDGDPEFTQEARDIVRSNICKNLQKPKGQNAWKN